MSFTMWCSKRIEAAFPRDPPRSPAWSSARPATGRHNRPLFRRRKTPIQDPIRRLQSPAPVQLPQQDTRNPGPYPAFLPRQQSPVARALGPVFPGHILPPASGLQHMRNPVERLAILRPGAVLSSLSGQQGFDQLPLRIGQFGVSCQGTASIPRREWKYLTVYSNAPSVFWASRLTSLTNKVKSTAVRPLLGRRPSRKRFGTSPTTRKAFKPL